MSKILELYTRIWSFIKIFFRFFITSLKCSRVIQVSKIEEQN